MAHIMNINTYIFVLREADLTSSDILTLSLPRFSETRSALILNINLPKKRYKSLQNLLLKQHSE